jgi:uncharacterized protein (TIGR02246 family)
MKKMNFSGIAIICVALSLLVTGCGTPSDNKTSAVSAEQVMDKPDLAAIKAEIQALESAWSQADNARDVNAVAAFYADDAISMSNDKPTQSGKAAILADIEEGMGKKAVGNTVSYETLEVFGDENIVTEIGKATVKNVSGNVVSTGKYMAVWENRNGSYICIRDIYNNDAKEK